MCLHCFISERTGERGREGEREGGREGEGTRGKGGMKGEEEVLENSTHLPLCLASCVMSECLLFETDLISSWTVKSCKLCGMKRQQVRNRSTGTISPGR